MGVEVADLGRQPHQVREFIGDRLEPRAVPRRVAQVDARAHETRGRALYHEIDALKEKIDTPLASALHVARKVGNTGAHMQGDVNAIVEVDPDEAALLLGLLEQVLDEWYVRDVRRPELLERVNALAKDRSSS